VLLQAAYRRAANVSVPAPVDPGFEHTRWWYDEIAFVADALARAGFSAVLLPPVLKTSAGSSPGADGYGPYDDYDIGSKPQCGSTATRFGTRAQLARCVATLHANGLDVYVDTVPHQRMGGSNGTYRYRGSAGDATGGRFPKDPPCFVGAPPRGPRDPIAGPVADDIAFGDELAPINARPQGYVLGGLIDAGAWLTRALDIDGYRIDDVKGMAVEAIHAWCTSAPMATRFAVAEYFDGNPATLNWWAFGTAMAGRCCVFDFPLHFTLEAMCNGASSFDMSALDHAGFAGIAPLNAVTFVENPDTDTDGFGTIVTNKLLAYAYILTSEGYPCVYYRDYMVGTDGYGLKPWIDNLIWIHENLAFGETTQRYKDARCFAFERLGYPNLLVGLNNDGSQPRSIDVQTAFGANVRLHEYSGHGNDVWTDGSGAVSLEIPANVDGRGYVCYSRPGYARPFVPTSRTTTQVFEGAADLDLAPLSEGRALEAARAWCAAETTLSLVLEPLAAQAASCSLLVEIVDPHDTVIARGVWRGATTPALHLATEVRASGWCRALVTATNLAHGACPYTCTLTFTSPQKADL
jgi:alpha-amylase